MSDVTVIPPEHVATRRAVARGQWLATLAHDRTLDPVSKQVLSDPRNLDAWWPGVPNVEAAA